MAYFSLYNSSVHHHELITKLNLTVRVRRLTSLSHLTETVRHILCYSRLICVIYVIIIEGLKMAEADSLGRSKRVKLLGFILENVLLGHKEVALSGCLNLTKISLL